MKNQAMRPNNLTSEADIERDLWDALLHAEGVSCAWQPGESLTEEMITVEENPAAHISYPWNPATPEAEAFFTEAETPSIFDGWQPNEIATRSDAFFAHLDHLWSALPLQTTLVQRFAIRMPETLLASIANRAQQVMSASTSLADQLVQCVQDILPSLSELAEDDLYVLARPLAHAMRDADSQAIDTALAAVRPLGWDALSETEKARLSLAIARYALAEIEATVKQ